MERHYWRPKLNGLVLNTTDHLSDVWLEGNFEEDDVLNKIRGMANGKAHKRDD